MNAAEYLADLEHNGRRRWVKLATGIQELWGNLSFLWVDRPDLTPCPRCRRSDPIDAMEDSLDRWGVLRRRHPMLEPDQIDAIVRAGAEAEAAMVAKFQGGKRA